MKVLLSAAIFLGVLMPTWSQKPKLAVVLSGGGAKGMAHIPLLKALDSLGVKPDLIVGNSMGSIIGGLYAIGYSADSIEQIALAIDWDQILGTKVTLDYINNAERDEYQKYSLEVSFDKNGVALPLGLIDGQELGMWLSKVSLPVSNINDFDQMPIPYRCVATDIENGKEILFKSGDIAIAMRASMAIPSVFTPVRYNDLLLVDGGILNNFPVNIAQEWGADIIIGSDVSGGLKSGEELESIPGLLFQSAMISSNLLNESQKERCDVLLDHIPHLTYGTGDFKSTPQIIKQGDSALQENLGTLVKILEPFSKPGQHEERLPPFPSTITVDEVVFQGTDERNIRLLANKFNLAEKTFTINELEDRIRLADGSRLFQKITYHVETKGNRRTLKFDIKERNKLYTKGGIHYDTEQGAGIVMNVTARDFIGRSSRTLFTVDAAENPKFRIQQQGYITKHQKFWYRAEYFSEQLIQSIYQSGLNSEDFKFFHYSGKFELNRDLGNNSYIGGFFKFTFDRYRPAVSVEVRPITGPDNSIKIEQIRHPGQSLGLLYHRNNMNKRFFPTTGNQIQFKASYYYQQSAELDFYARDSTANAILDSVFADPQPLGEILQFDFIYRDNVSLGPNLTFQPKINLFSQHLGDSLYFTFGGLLKSFFIGGIEDRPREQYLTFSGLRDGEANAIQGALLSLDLQWAIRPNIFVIPNASIGILGQRSFEDFISNLDNASPKWFEDDVSYLHSFGGRIGIMTPIGPVQFGVSKVSQIKRLRTYFSLGMHFL